MTQVTIERARPQDAARLAEVFNRSFYADYVKYGECPGYGKTAADMLESIAKYHVYKILAGSETVGAISVQEKGEGVYFLGALCVMPEHMNKGIGQRAMALLDAQYPSAKQWALETPADKAQNHYFYKKLGYTVTREYMDGSVPISYFERKIV